jgi:dihydrofolate reductase
VRKVVSGLFISVDGVVESPDQWQESFDEEMGAELAKTLASTDAVLLGRVTYADWAQYWPNYSGDGDDAAFANWINSSPKYVVSTTLDSVDEWPNSTLLKGDFAESIGALKAGEGKSIAVAGSATLVRSLLAHDLLDELQLMISPVVAGGGRQRLFDDDGELKHLDLVDARGTSTGVIIATYRPRR